MPRPIEGLVPIVEYGSKFEADAAVGLLASEGIDATPSYDPAMNSVAPHWATDRTFEVLVDVADAERAVAVLEAQVGGLPPEFTEPWEPSPRTARTRSHARRVYVFLALLLVVPAMVVTAVAIANAS